MNSAIFAGLTSGALWGFALLVPKVLSEYPSGLVASGRFFFYGIISLFILLSKPKKTIRLLNKEAVSKAITFAVVGNSLYYLFLVLGIRFAGVTTGSLFVGLMPVTVAVAGNRGRLSKNLMPSVLLITVGILAINYHLSKAETAAGSHPFWGIPFLLLCIGMWTWYGLANAQFLRKHPQISDSHWTSMTGVFTMLTSFGIAGLEIGFNETFTVSEVFRAVSDPHYWFWSAVLGFGASWLALAFWNMASRNLPATLSGQLIVSETVFALIYGYIYQSRFPSAVEFFAIICMVGGVLLAVATLRPRKNVDLPPPV